MQVRIFECGHDDGKETRHYVGTFSIESIRKENADGFDPGELDELEKSLSETGRGSLAGFVGLWHEYEAVMEPETPAGPAI